MQRVTASCREFRQKQIFAAEGNITLLPIRHTKTTEGKRQLIGIFRPIFNQLVQTNTVLYIKALH